MKFNKSNFEWYAKEELCCLYDKLFTKLEKSESPDFQSHELNVGVEVTRGLDKSICEKYSIIDGNLKSVESLKMLKEKYKNSKFKEDFDKNLGILSGGIPFFRYEQDISSIIDNLKDCIQKKTYMLNTNYVHFENNYLFIFGENGTLKLKDMEQIFEYYKANNENLKFDIIFIDVFERLFVLNFKDDKIEEKQLNEEIIEKCTKYALTNNEINK